MTDKELAIKQYESLNDWFCSQLELIDTLVKRVKVLKGVTDSISDIDAQVALFEQLIILSKVLKKLMEEIIEAWEQYKNDM